MKVSEQIIEVLNALCEKLGLALDWTTANVVPYIRQLCEKYVKYEVWTSVFYIFIWFALLIFSVWFYKSKKNALNKFLMEENESRDMGDAFFDSATGWLWVLGLIMLIVAVTTFILVAADQGKDIITCLTFPEKMLYELINQSISSDGLAK